MRRNKKHTVNKTDNFKEVFDHILDENNLRYSDLDFQKTEADVLKAYNELNKNVHQTPNYLKNIKEIVSSFNFNLILKPLYTVVLTTIIIIAIIELKDTNEVNYAEISVEQGEKIKLYVTDEIKIWVNSESNIKIPLKLKRNPTFILDGEAYFEINKKNGRPITVKSKGIKFKVSQASFNINANENELIATLKNGEVTLYNPDLPKSTTLNLVAKDQVLYNPSLEFIAVDTENSMNYLAWHTGKLSFNNTPMYEVVETISGFYEIPILITNQEILKKDLNAQFENADIDKILDTIQSTFNCEISGDGSKIIIN
jgi:ferric-dicitrate binding protein FerR (iron transport regulator)